MEYGNEHRKLLQKLLASPSQTRDSFCQLCKECFHDGTRSSFTEQNLIPLIKLINKKLRPLRMAIKQRRCEDTGKEFIILVNLADSPATRSSSEFSTLETDLFKKILEAIVLSETGSVSSTHCISLSISIDKLNKTAAQDALHRFCAQQWLQENNGRVSLTPRSISELDPMLRELYPEEMADCRLCLTLVIKGSQCSSCDTKLHLHCLQEITRTTPKFKCPGCNRPWKAALQNLDETAAMDESTVATQPNLSQTDATRSQPRRVSRKRKSSTELDQML